MERFLQPGGSFNGSIYAPISYPPLPLLAFKVVPGSAHARLAAAGALRSVDPDRLVIKKIVLTGGTWLRLRARAWDGAEGLHIWLLECALQRARPASAACAVMLARADASLSVHAY